MADNRDFFAVPLDRTASSQSSGGEDTHHDFLIPQTPSKLRSSLPSSPSPRISQSPQSRASIKRARLCLDDPLLDGLEVFAQLSQRGVFKPLVRPTYTAEENEKLEKIWNDVNIGDILSEQNAITISSHSPLYEAYEVLASRGIMSAPIVEDHKIQGMQDYRSLCNCVLQLLVFDGVILTPQTSLSSHSTHTSTTQSPRDSMTNLHEHTSPLLRASMLISQKSDSDTDAMTLTPKMSFSHSPRLSPTHSGASSFSLLSPKRTNSSSLMKYTTVASLLKHASTGCIVDSLPKQSKIVHQTKTTCTLATLLPQFQKGVHRVCVVDDEEHFLGVISQSDAIRTIYQHFDQMQFICQKTLLQLGLDRTSTPITLAQNARVVDALRLQLEANVSSIAQVDSNGCQTYNFSMTDIKYVFKQGHLAYLYKSCLDFMTDVRNVKEVECDYETKLSVFYSTPTATLQRVISLLIATRTHRIWIVDDLQKPISVVTLTDILRIQTPDSIQQNINSINHTQNLNSLVPANTTSTSLTTLHDMNHQTTNTNINQKTPFVQLPKPKN